MAGERAGERTSFRTTRATLRAALVAALIALPATVAAGPLDPATRFHAPPPPADAVAHVARLRAEGRDALAARVEAMAEAPRAIWLDGGTPETVRERSEAITKRAEEEGTLPVLVAYNLPHRDCSGDSAGGAADAEAYAEWIDALATGIGERPAMVILEPDGVAIVPHETLLGGTLDWCQPPDADPASAARERYALLRGAVERLGENEGTRVYLDAGHADWHPVGEIAARLVRAGVGAADGFFVNASNYVGTERSLAGASQVSECLLLLRTGGVPTDCDGSDAYRERVAGLVAASGVDAMTRFVVDTSRNGRGAWRPDVAYPNLQTWCNAPGRAVGPATSVRTASPLADAYLWIKVPGESDGQCTRGRGAPGEPDPEWGVASPPAGAWFEFMAEELAGG